MELNNNQAALILSASEDGEIRCRVPGHEWTRKRVVPRLGQEIDADEAFQAELMEMLQGESEEKDD